jgi:hypothetical protein
MIFELKTLIDITETGARKGDDPREQLQQQNFHTALQTISLRANPTITKSPRSELIALKGLGFGSKYTGKHRVWTWQFSFEQADSHNIDFLINDFDLVPVINNLDETIKIENAAFITTDTQHTNTVFSVFDDK